MLVRGLAGFACVGPRLFARFQQAAALGIQALTLLLLVLAGVYTALALFVAIALAWAIPDRGLAGE